MDPGANTTQYCWWTGRTHAKWANECRSAVQMRYGIDTVERDKWPQDSEITWQRCNNISHCPCDSGLHGRSKAHPPHPHHKQSKHQEENVGCRSVLLIHPLLHKTIQNTHKYFCISFYPIILFYSLVLSVYLIFAYLGWSSCSSVIPCYFSFVCMFISCSQFQKMQKSKKKHLPASLTSVFSILQNRHTQWWPAKFVLSRISRGLCL